MVEYYIDTTNNDVDTGLFSIRDIISGFEVETVDSNENHTHGVDGWLWLCFITRAIGI